jgi:hypothetical protein
MIRLRKEFYLGIFLDLNLNLNLDPDFTSPEE